MSDKTPAGSLATPPHRRGRGYVRLAVLVAILAAAGYAAYRLGVFELGNPERLGDVIRRASDVPALPVLFVLAYVVATVFGVPGTVFTLAGGAIFGVLFGSFLNWVGAT